MSHARARILLASLLILGLAPALAAQQTKRTQPPAPVQEQQTPATPPRDEQEPVQVFTEEVRLPVFVMDERGRFEHALEMQDFVVVEDDVPQEIRSLRRVPANVLLLLDTGNQLALAKNVSTTRDICLRFIENLSEDARVAVLQFNERVELLQDWTSDRSALTRALRNRLYSGKSTRLADAVRAAAEKLSDLPPGSRHVLLITDGVESPGGSSDYAEAVRQLAAAQATVHVISYTALTRAFVKERYPDSVFRTPPKNNPQRDATIGGDPTMPPGQTRNPTFTLGSIDLDFKRRSQARDYARATQASESRLISLAEETGGRALLPESNAEMLRQGAEVAREIDSQYVITYQPKRPLASAPIGEYRRVSVGLRRAGLKVYARRGYVVTR